MTEWIDLPNGNAFWCDGDIKCIVYLKKRRRSSWRWLISERGCARQSPYTYPSKNKAKQNAQPILKTLSLGLSWQDSYDN